MGVVCTPKCLLIFLTDQHDKGYDLQWSILIWRSFWQLADKDLHYSCVLVHANFSCLYYLSFCYLVGYVTMIHIWITWEYRKQAFTQVVKVKQICLNNLTYFLEMMPRKSFHSFCGQFQSNEIHTLMYRCTNILVHECVMGHMVT